MIKIHSFLAFKSTVFITHPVTLNRCNHSAWSMTIIGLSKLSALPINS